MSSGVSCTCDGTKKEKMTNWVISQFRCNHSAFNGYKKTNSDYSAIRCLKCRGFWRTKADYVISLKHE